MEKYVLVTTEHRGIFAGVLVREDEANRIVELKNARCAIRWGTTRGWIELAQVGPSSDSKIGAIAPDLKLYGVTGVATCTEEARLAWEKA